MYVASLFCPPPLGVRRRSRCTVQGTAGGAMEASIECERFLAALHIRSVRDRGNKDQVPTVGRYRTGDDDQRMRSEQDVAKTAAGPRLEFQGGASLG